ncbi:MAG: hypothetical protein PHX34_05310 [Candidatus Shapirobacteria bacterium]|nr:hypothetical protein [Candidatus Shapirobacteria bacterium]
MKIEVNFNLIGVVPVPRSIFTLINQGVLTQSDLFWYMVFITQAEFGHMYTTVGVVTAGDKVIAEQLNCDPTTVNKKRNKLIKIGLLKNHKEGTQISNYQMFTPNKKSGVVPITTAAIKDNGQEAASKLFLNEDDFLKKRQELIERQSHKLTQNL